MRHRLVIVLTLVFSFCASAQLRPTPEHPLSFCAYSCPEWRGDENGFMFRRQHICRNGKRWLQDIRVTGEKTERGVDGAITVDVWIATQGDYSKQDVDRCTCDEAIRRAVTARPSDERGIMPGEDDHGRPINHRW